MQKVTWIVSINTPSLYSPDETATYRSRFQTTLNLPIRQGLYCPQVFCLKMLFYIVGQRAIRPEQLYFILGYYKVREKHWVVFNVGATQI